MDHAKIRNLAAQYTEAWCSQNPMAVASFYEENGSLTINDGDPAVGREALAEVAQDFMNAFPDLKVHFDDLVFVNNDIRYHWTLTGTNTGAGGSGRRVRISGYELWEIGPNGLIANSKGHFDNDDYQRQIGS